VPNMLVEIRFAFSVYYGQHVVGTQQLSNCAHMYLRSRCTFFFFLMLEPPSNSGRQTGDTEKVLTEGPQILGVAFVKPALGTTVTAFCIFVVRFWKIWTYYRRRVCVCVYVSKCNNRFF